MDVIKDLENIPKDLKYSLITIGNFDGVHLGHQQIFQRLITEAKEKNRKSAVITFEPHPQKIIHPERRPFFLLTPLEEKLDFMASLGIDVAVVIAFSPEFARITAEDFVRTVLWNKFRLQKIFIGYDYAFGNNKEGNAGFLEKLGEELGFQVEEISAVTIDGIIVSSTNIRLAILEGNVGRAARMLDRPYTLNGTVVKGYRRGTGIGFPTANIKSEKVIPGIGVYVIIAEIEGTRYQGVLNIGYNPTFGNEELSTEVHLLDFQGDIYGKEIGISFIDRLRDERKFESSEKLVEQISRDIQRAKEILEPYSL